MYFETLNTNFDLTYRQETMQETTNKHYYIVSLQYYPEYYIENDTGCLPEWGYLYIHIFIYLYKYNFFVQCLVKMYIII